MKCPLPKCFRHRFVSECKPMQVGANDDEFKQAAFTIIERHYRYAAPFETFQYETGEITRGDDKIGKFRITVEQI